MTDAQPGPVLIELDSTTPAAPEAAPPVPDTDAAPPAVARAAALAARRQSGLARLFWALFAALGGLILSLSAWAWITDLIARVPLLGAIASALLLTFVAVLALMALREAAAILRLARIDAMQRAAATARAARDLDAARDVSRRLSRLYAGRAEMARALAILQDRQAEQLDADAVLSLAEVTLLAPLDAAAAAEIERAARQVATVTALVPLAMADVAAALTSNLGMIRRIAEIYGGRAGTLGSWRLTRAVMGHLVATGALAVGDDLIGSVAGGSVLSKLSRRFGEGVVNGALTARVGVAAAEVCRPLPFRTLPRPGVGPLLARALRGLFGGGEAPPP